MNITLIAPRFPYPLDRGDRLTIYHLLQHFSKRHRLSFICFRKPNMDMSWIDKIAPFCERVETIPLRKWRAAANSAVGLFGKDPLQVAFHRDPNMRRTLHSVIKATKPDLLYAHYIRTAPFVEPYHHVPRVLAMQLSMTLNYKRLAENAPDLPHKLIYDLEYRRLQRYEAEIARRFDKVLLISPNDLRAVNANPPLDNVFFSPHGVDFDYFTPDKSVPQIPNSIVFTGGMKYMPNVVAMTTFVQETLPLIRQQIPDVKLFIVGADPVAAVRALADDPNITVTGRVPDMRRYLDQAQVGIAPMQVTAGLLNKVLEGLSMEKPMVVTPQSNEGIRARADEHLLIADTPQLFADKVVELLRNPQRRAELGQAGRQFILDEWSWDKHFNDLEAMFVSLVANFERPAHAKLAPVLT